MSKVLVIIPTYDERENVKPAAAAVLKFCPEAHILFVDDNSPDGTGQVLDEMTRGNSSIHVLHQGNKRGLGRAYITGFKWAIERKYNFIFEMDADLSHDPKEMPNFLKAIENADLVLGTRYLHGIRITNWPLGRLVLSKAAATYVRLITGLPATDPTGGYKCFRREVLESIGLDSIWSNGYSFQIEMSYKTWMLGFRIAEIPITFEDRRSGYSKMNTRILREALWIVWKLALRHGLRRSPPRVAGANAERQ